MISPTPYKLPPVSGIEQRKFLCGPAFQEGQLSLTIASGGVGKTSLCIAEAVAMAGGISLLQDQPSDLKVWFISAEEDKQEMNRRIAAACEVGHVARPNSFYLDCVNRDEIQIASTEKGVDHTLVEHIIKTIIKNKIKIVIVDPFICTHSVSENDNVKIDKVARAWRRIATEGNCAVHIVHHQAKESKKGSDGARGASALRDAARFVRTLELIKDKREIERLKLSPDGNHIRIKVTKSNYQQSDYDHIVELINRTLMNGPVVAGKATAGDKVGVIDIYPKRDPHANSIAASSGTTTRPAGVSRRSAARTTAPTQNEIDIIINIASGGRYKEGPKDWIGEPIAAALNLDLPTDRLWIVAVIKDLLATNKLIKWKDKSSGNSGQPPIFLKPFGFGAAPAGQVSTAPTDEVDDPEPEA